MSLLTIVQAADQFKVTRSRIYRAISSGKITPHLDDAGVKLIDPQDMVRVFNSQRTKNSTKKTVQTIKTVQNEQHVKLLEQQLELAKEKAEFYKKQVDEIRKDYDDFKRAIGFKNSPPPLQSEQEQNIKNDTVQTEQGLECNDIPNTGQNVQIKHKEKIKKFGLIGRLARTLFDDQFD